MVGNAQERDAALDVAGDDLRLLGAGNAHGAAACISCRNGNGAGLRADRAAGAAVVGHAAFYLSRRSERLFTGQNVGRRCVSSCRVVKLGRAASALGNVDLRDGLVSYNERLRKYKFV